MKLWGGRFTKETDKTVKAFTESLYFDVRLAMYDIKGSIAHAKMLADIGIITAEEGSQIVGGLEEIRDGFDDAVSTHDFDDEDIHTVIERMLSDKIGSLAGKLHTARSRNDQVATDLRLFAKDAALNILDEIEHLSQTIIGIAEKYTGVIFPGMTHLQSAQPVLFAHHMMAYFWMLERDWRRFRCCYNHSDWSPLGAAALAGTGWPIDREQTARELGFKNIIPNSIDAVSDRDFVVLFQAMSSILIMHLSRLSEEIVLWSSPEFAFITLDDSFATGSSIMPQKKNPDVAELARGKTGRVFGNLMGILTVLKGLPLSYNRDLQEDKEGLFDTVDVLIMAIPSLNGMLDTMMINEDAMKAAAKRGFSTATDIADYLCEKGMPFREAHEVTGKIVKYCLDNGITALSDLAPEKLKEFSALLDDDIIPLLSVEGSVGRRNSYGGTAPDAVAVQIEEAKKVLAKQKIWRSQPGPV